MILGSLIFPVSLFAQKNNYVQLLQFPDQQELPPAQNDPSFGLEKLDQYLQLGDASLIQIIANLINLALSFIAIILLVMIIYAGFLWMTSGGDEEKKEKAKGMIINAIIGVVIIFLSVSLVQFVFDALQSAVGGNGQQQEPF